MTKRTEPLSKKKKIGIVVGIVAGVLALALMITLLCVFLIEPKSYELKNGKYYLTVSAQMNEDVIIEISGTNYTVTVADGYDFPFEGSGTYYYDGKNDFTFYKGEAEYLKGTVSNNILTVAKDINFVDKTTYTFKYSEKSPSEIVVDDGYTSGLKYSYNTGQKSYTLTGIGSSTSDTIVIPDTVRLVATSVEMPVTAIADGAFKGNTKIKSVTMGDNIVSIGASAFEGCTSLTELNLGNNVTSIGTGALDGTNLSYNTVNGINFLNKWAISLNTTASHVSVPEGTVGLYDSLFAFDETINSIDLPSSLKSINDKAFYGLKSLNSIGIYGDDSQSEFTVYGGGLYDKDIKKLYVQFLGGGSVVIPDSVTEISYGALYGRSDIESLTLPFVGKSKTASSAEGLFGYVFGSVPYDGGVLVRQYYDNLNYVDGYIPSSLKSVTVTADCNINSGAFYGVSLTGLSIEKAVYIAEGALEKMTDITSLTLPFVGTNNSKSFASVFGKSEYEGGIICNTFDGLNNKRYYVPSTLVSVTIQNSVLPQFAFYGCSGLQSIKFNQSVALRYEEIGEGADVDKKLVAVEGAFAGCDSLVTVDLGSNYILSDGNLYDKDFEFVVAVLMTKTDSSLVLGDSVKGILEYALYGSRVENLTLSANTRYFSAQSLTGSKVTTLDVPAQNGYFTDFNSQGLIVTKDLTQAVYLEDGFSGILTLPSNLSDINSSVLDKGTVTGFAFDGENAKFEISSGIILNKNKTSILAVPNSLSGDIILPNTITSFDKSAFENLGLTSITLVDSLGAESSGQTYSSQGGVLYNSTMTVLVFVPKDISGDLILPSTLTDIPDGAFADRVNLTSITADARLSKIGGYAFENITAQINLANDGLLKGISAESFRNYKGTSLVIPESVTSIAEGAFYGCGNLTSVTLPFVGVSASATNEKALIGVVFGSSPFDGAVEVRQAFYDMKEFISYYLPSNLKEVTVTKATTFKRGAFSYVTSLETVNVGYDFTVFDYSLACDVFKGATAFSDFNVAEAGYYQSQNGDLFRYALNYTYVSSDITRYENIGGQYEVSDKGTYILVGDMFVELYTGEDGEPVKFRYFENSVFSSYNGVLYNKDKTAVIFCPLGKSGVLELASSVKNINSAVFENAVNVSAYDIDISSSVFTSSGGAIIRKSDGVLTLLPSDYAFDEDGDLLYVGDWVYGIKDGADKASITQITIKDGTTGILSNAFVACVNLNSVSIPSSLETIGSFAFSGCNSLTVLPSFENVVTIGAYAFRCDLSSSVATSDITLPLGVQSLGDYAFYGRTVTINCEAISKPSGWTANCFSAGNKANWGSV